MPKGCSVQCSFWLPPFVALEAQPLLFVLERQALYMYLKQHAWAQRAKDEERGHEMLGGGDEGEAA